MRRELHDPGEAGGPDPIDLEVRASRPPSPFARFDVLLRTRAAFGLRPINAPAVLFIPLGIVLGPRALNILSIEVMSMLETVVAIALAGLGVFVGLALDLRARVEKVTLVAASAEAAVTIVVVSATVLFLLGQWGLGFETGPIVIALTLGICAAASSASAAEEYDDPVHRLATRIADLDDVLPIALGAIVLAGVHEPNLGRAIQLGILTAALGLAIGAAGWLLFDSARGEAERGVFVVGSLALLGGTSTYLGLSPLLAGTAAGLFWTYAPGRADQIIRRDLQKVQHPLVVLLLLSAGAGLQITPAAIWLAAPFLLFRLSGKLVGGWLASRLAGVVAPAQLGAYLIPPGVLGIAFALNFMLVGRSAAGVAVVTAVALGSLASEILAVAAVPARERA